MQFQFWTKMQFCLLVDISYIYWQCIHFIIKKHDSSFKYCFPLWKIAQRDGKTIFSDVLLAANFGLLWKGQPHSPTDNHCVYLYYLILGPLVTRIPETRLVHKTQWSTQWSLKPPWSSNVHLTPLISSWFLVFFKCWDGRNLIDFFQQCHWVPYYISAFLQIRQHLATFRLPLECVVYLVQYYFNKT